MQYRMAARKIGDDVHLFYYPHHRETLIGRLVPTDGDRWTFVDRDPPHPNLVGEDYERDEASVIRHYLAEVPPGDLAAALAAVRRGWEVYDADERAEAAAEQWAENGWLRHSERFDPEAQADLELHEQQWPWGYGRFTPPTAEELAEVERERERILEEEAAALRHAHGW